MAGFKMKMAARTGLFSGSITFPGATTKAKFTGAIHGNGGPSRRVFTAITENALQTGLNTGVIEITRAHGLAIFSSTLPRPIEASGTNLPPP